jgi:glycosyltransferase involved in cell wall biosynthesis
MKKISVIIPIYNVEKYLKRCIESIIKQTYSNLEIILVDDGSPDGCAKICDEYKNKDERIVVIHKKNGGLSDARNAGLKVATGEIISYIDSDDYVDLDMYEKMTKAMEEKNADIVVCGTNIDYEDGHTKVKCEKEEKSFNREEALIELNSFKSFDMAVWNKLYKREVVDKIEFPVGKKSEDYFVMYQYFARAKKVVIINQAKYHYFQRSNSISRGKNVTHDYIEGSKSQKEFFKKNFPDLNYVGNTAYAFSYIATYNRYIKNELKMTNEMKKEFKKEVRKYLKDINGNSHISRSKKIQATLFSYSLFIYKIALKVISKE